jgi:hypothetical protein
MSKLLDFHKNKLKSQSVLNEQVRLQYKCRLEDCNKDLTIFDGPGSDSYCRDHQLMLAEYGGMGKADRPHTFYRNWVCSDCGYDARQDPAILSIEDPWQQLLVMRGVMHGDHIVRKSDGGSDTADNINSLCCRCHMIKTYKEKDYLKGTVDNSENT